jgi:hypothetical protein
MPEKSSLAKAIAMWRSAFVNRPKAIQALSCNAATYSFLRSLDLTLSSQRDFGHDF